MDCIIAPLKGMAQNTLGWWKDSVIRDQKKLFNPFFHCVLSDSVGAAEMNRF